MTTGRICQKCGQALRDDALEGLCGRCLAQWAFESSDGDFSRGRSPAAGGRLFGDYELLGEIARGGMGVVYKARQTSLNRLVALKMILGGPFSNPEFVQRFQVEAEAVAQLHHPNIVTIYEMGERDGHRFLSMEHIEGQNFAEVAREKPLPSRRAALYVKTIAEAIHYAHGQGIIHRDIKPSNLLLDLLDQPHVTDFGLAKLIKADASLTLTGQALGSPGYMAPELASGKSAETDARGDVYSLGAVLYYLVTGRPPFQGDTPQDILLEMRNSEPVAPRRLNPGVPVNLETVCLKCLHPEPAKRYASARELADDLQRFLADEPVRARPVSKLEKFRLWCRRRPIQTALSAALAMAVILGLAGIIEEWRRAEAHALGESRQLQISKAYAKKIRLELYAADINLAAHALEHGDYGLARRTLAAQQPKFGEEDLRGFEWRYLSNLSRGNQLATLPGHSWIVTCAAFSPDGGKLATGAQDGMIKIWDVNRHELITTLPGKGGAIWSVAFSPDGALLMAAGNFIQVEIWDAARWELVRTLPGQLAALSKTGSLIVTSGSSPFYWERTGKVAMWDYRTGKKVREFDRTGRTLALAPDGTTLAVAQPSQNVEIWDAASGKVLRTLETTSSVWSVAFSPDGLRLVTAGWSDEALVWNLAANAPPEKLRGHSRSVWSAVFSPDGANIVTTGSDQTVRFWDGATLQPGNILRGHGNEVWCATFSKDGKLLATGGKDQQVMLWAADEPQRPQDLLNDREIRPIFSPDGGRILIWKTLNDAWRPQIWNIAPRRLTLNLRWEAGLGFTPDGKQTIGLDKQRAALEMWSGESPTPTLVTLQNAKGGIGEFERFGFSPSTEQFFAINTGGTIRLWETGTGKLLGTASGPKPPLRGAALSPGGKWLAVSLERDSFIHLFELSANRESLLSGHRDFVCGLAFSPDGETLASGSVDGTLKLWDCVSGRELATLPGHLEETTDVAFSPDGKTLASVCRKDSIKLWHLPTLRELVSIDFPRAGEFLQFSPDGTRLAVTMEDNTVHFFEAPMPAEVNP
ncbi:MAG: repeat-containing protein [Pedosphaera sp.]|nr:repeat-containing protein [Pedosphaera sp.]